MDVLAEDLANNKKNSINLQIVINKKARCILHLAFLYITDFYFLREMNQSILFQFG